RRAACRRRTHGRLVSPAAAAMLPGHHRPGPPALARGTGRGDVADRLYPPLGMHPGALPLGWREPVPEREVRLPQGPEQRERPPRIRGRIAPGLGPAVLVERLDRRSGGGENQPDPVGAHEFVVGQMGDDLLDGPLPRRRASGAECRRYGREQRGERGGSGREERERLAVGHVAADAGLVLRLCLGHGLGFRRSRQPPGASTRRQKRGAPPFEVWTSRRLWGRGLTTQGSGVRGGRASPHPLQPIVRPYHDRCLGRGRASCYPRIKSIAERTLWIRNNSNAEWNSVIMPTKG